MIKVDKKYFTYAVDEQGEVSEAYGRFTPQEQINAIHKKLKQKKTQNELGAFTWLLFNNTQELLPNVSPANITRLMYVSTFLGYYGYLINNNIAMTKKELQKKLKLDRRYFSAFWDEMIEQNIIIEQENKIYLNNNLFRKGTIKKDLPEDFTKLYINGIRYIYENCEDAKQHKTLCYLFKAIPYINKQYNIVSKNDINIKERDQIIPMTVPEFGKLVGIAEKNSRRLIKQLVSIEVQGEYAFLLETNGDGTFMTVNPHLYYAGSDWHKVKHIADWCIPMKKMLAS